MDLTKYPEGDEDSVIVPRNLGRRVRGVVFDLDGTLINSTVNFGLMRLRIVGGLIAHGIPASELEGGRTTADDSAQRDTSLLISNDDIFCGKRARFIIQP